MKTDHPFKIALDEFPEEILSTLLDRKVLKVEAEKPEIIRPSYAFNLDSLNKVTFEDGEERHAQVEFQGRGSRKAMALRMFNYLAATLYMKNVQDLPIDLIVVYVEKGTGADDTGIHTFGSPVIAQIKYKVLRLWQEDAQQWAQQENPAALSLIGQTHFRSKQEERQIVKATFHKLLEFPDREKRITLLLMLLQDKELSEEVTQMAQQYGLAMDTPFIKNLIQIGVNQGVERGLLQGRQEGRQKGEIEGRVQEREAMHELLQRNILETIATRFDETVNLKALLPQLEKLSVAQLVKALSQANITPDVAAFRGWLEQHNNQPPPT